VLSSSILRNQGARIDADHSGAISLFGIACRNLGLSANRLSVYWSVEIVAKTQRSVPDILCPLSTVSVPRRDGLTRQRTSIHEGAEVKVPLSVSSTGILPRLNITLASCFTLMCVFCHYLKEPLSKQLDRGLCVHLRRDWWYTSQ